MCIRDRGRGVGEGGVYSVIVRLLNFASAMYSFTGVPWIESTAKPTYNVSFKSEIVRVRGWRGLFVQLTPDVYKRQVLRLLV